jgi:ABC-type Fe3+/spermidine/putrescine transport system ATPase subunit
MTVRRNVGYSLEIRKDSEVDAKVAEVFSLMRMESLALIHGNVLKAPPLFSLKL